MKEVVERNIAAVEKTPPLSASLVQRKCACGGAAGMGGDCEDCRQKRDMVQRKATTASPARFASSAVHNVVASAGRPLDSATLRFMEPRFSGVATSPVSSAEVGVAPHSQLAMNRPGDRYEQEADQVAEQVMQFPQAAFIGRGHDFSQVRVHTDDCASRSARAIGALAYTVGNDIVFSSGQYAPHTESGRRLLAHELTHTLQQRGAGMVMGVWDKAETECADHKKKHKWIKSVVVTQEGSQKVTLGWSDGAEDSDDCSTGKGHCCVDSSNPEGVACTIARSHVDGSNCTLITEHRGFLVKDRLLDHKGIHFWTEIHHDRAIALHQYDDQGVVNGSPLSHGCVRLHEATAKKIFCNVRRNKTWVRILGFARPQCDDTSLQNEWRGDFRMGGRDLSKADGDLKKEIKETRKELSDAFGRELTAEEIQKFTEKDIPRCKKTAPLPKPASPAKP